MIFTIMKKHEGIKLISRTYTHMRNRNESIVNTMKKHPIIKANNNRESKNKEYTKQ